jgi:anti-sigma B factor antagonist
MNTTTTPLDDRTVLVQLEGRLDMASAPGLRPPLQEAISSGHNRVVLDLEGVEFMDSSGLGQVISGLKVARQAGGDLRLARVPEQVRMVLQITTLDRILQPYDTVEQAMEAADGA